MTLLMAQQSTGGIWDHLPAIAFASMDDAETFAFGCYAHAERFAIRHGLDIMKHWDHESIAN